MKNKAIIAAGLITLALLAGCNKAEEPTTTNAPGSAPSAATESPAPAAEPTPATPAPVEVPLEGK